MEQEVTAWSNYIVPSINSRLQNIKVDADKMEALFSKYIGKEAYHCAYDLEPREDFVKYVGKIRPAFERVWVDFDHEASGGGQALIEVKDFLTWLQIKDVVIFFSGHKGFHIGIPLEYFDIPLNSYSSRVMSQIYHTLKRKWPTIDTSISDATRKFRLPGSMHPKTQLFKRQLTYDEAFSLTIEEIREMAKKSPGIIDLTRPDIDRLPLPILNNYLLDIDLTEKPTGPVHQSGDDLKHLPFQSFPKKKCIDRLFNSHAEEGTRHQIALILIHDLRQTKTPRAIADKKMDAWAKIVNYPSDRLGEIKQMLDKAYSNAEVYHFGCEHQIKAQNCSARCSVYAKLPKEKRPLVPDAPKQKTLQEIIYKEKGFYLIDELDGEKIPQYERMAKWVFDHKNMCFDDSTSLQFDGKKWSWLTKTDLSSFIRSANKGELEPQHLDWFAKMIKASCFVKNFGFENLEGKINVNNGVADIKTGTLAPHTYKNLFKYCSPVDFDPLATCPKWLQYLSDVFKGDEELRDLVQRMFGYIIIGGDPFLHKAFCLVGSGRNGKSTLLKVLKNVVGGESYATISMSKLDKEFSLVSLDGKLANIVEETPNDEINSEAFKNMVAGGEVRAAHKGFDEYSFHCKARFVFACNDMPQFRDKNISMTDRLIFLPFDRYFSDEERDPFIADKLIAELPGILNWAIEGAKRVVAEKFIPNPKASELTKESYRRESDTVYAWFSYRIDVKNGGVGITTTELYEKYKNWAESEGLKYCSNTGFSRRFKQLVKIECAKAGLPFEDDNRLNDLGRSRGYSCIFYK